MPEERKRELGARQAVSGGPGAEGYDRDVAAASVLWVVGGLALTIGLAMLLMWWLSCGLLRRQLAREPEPPPLAEAIERIRPPEPRLQVSPELELRELRAYEERVLGSYGWVSEKDGVARIPIERAMELVARDGSPEWPGPPRGEVSGDVAAKREPPGAGRVGGEGDGPSVQGPVGRTGDGSP